MGRLALVIVTAYPILQGTRLLEASPGLPVTTFVARGPRKFVANVFEVLIQMPRNGIVVFEHRQHIDKPEHLHLDGFVAHRPRHEPIFPPPTMKD